METTYHFNAYRDARSESKVWTVTTRNGAFIGHEHHHTEAQARGACGLDGGSTDPHYRPDGDRAFAPTIAASQNGR